MTQLTKEYFDERLKTLATKADLVDQTKDLKAYARAQTEELARMVKDGFDGVDRQLAGIIQMLDVRKRLEEHERKFARLEQTLNVKL